MGITITFIIFVIFCHWLFDFVLQTNEDAQGKSSSMIHLLNHTSSYSICWIFVMYPFLGLENAILFSAITFITHTATDYITSRWNTVLWQQKEVKRFFESIGFDQVLHYGQLFLTYQLLSQYGIN